MNHDPINPSDNVTPISVHGKYPLKPGMDMAPPLKHDGGGGTSGGMESRVTRLEVTMEHVREDMREIKDTLKEMTGKLSELPTKNDLWAWKWQWTAICVGTVAMIVGGIIGGLSWIQPAPVTPAAPAPIVITVPTPQPPAPIPR